MKHKKKDANAWRKIQAVNLADFAGLKFGFAAAIRIILVGTPVYDTGITSLGSRTPLTIVKKQTG